MQPSFTRVTLRVLALLGQVTWTKTVCFRGRVWGVGVPRLVPMWPTSFKANWLCVRGPEAKGGGGG